MLLKRCVIVNVCYCKGVLFPKVYMLTTKGALNYTPCVAKLTGVLFKVV